MLELLRLALQHFLLPFLLGGLGAIALLLRQIFLALGQLVELLQRIVNVSRLFLRARSRALLGLVLIFFRVEFQFEELGKIARRPATTTASSLRSKRNLNLPESSFGA